MCRRFGTGIALYRRAVGIQVVIISVGDQQTSAVGILSRAAREFPLIAVGLRRLKHGEIAPFCNTVA